VTEGLEPARQAEGLGGVPEHVDRKMIEQREGVLTRGRADDSRDSSPLAQAAGLGGVPEHVDPAR
jgi:hypothetical protein